MNLFFNAETKLLRGGWRLLIYLTLLVLPQLVTSIYASRTRQRRAQRTNRCGRDRFLLRGTSGYLYLVDLSPVP
jgi:hypothetical protein